MKIWIYTITMSHNSLPNNLTEICNALIFYLENNEQISLNEFMSFVPGPDFPCGGVLINPQDIKAAFETGKSKVSLKVRGDYIYNQAKGTITFTSIPYRTYRGKIKEQIGKKIDIFENILEDYDDLSNLGKTEIVFYLKKGITEEEALQKLFQYTDLQTTLSYNMNYLVDGTPKMCSMLKLVEVYINHRHNVITNVAKYDKKKAEDRLHIINGLLAATSKIDEVIKLIKSSPSKKEANVGLQKLLNIDEIQAKAILDMRLGSLSRLDISTLEKEGKEKESIIEETTKIITSLSYRREKLIAEIKKIKDDYGDERRTKLIEIEFKRETSKTKTKEKKVEMINIDPKTIKKSKNGTLLVEDDSYVIVLSNGEIGYRIPAKKIKESGVPTDICNLENVEILAAFGINPLPTEQWVIHVWDNGYMRKVSVEDYASISRGKEIKALKNTTKTQDANVIAVLLAKNNEYIHLENNDEESFDIGVNDLPETKRTNGAKQVIKAKKDKPVEVSKVELRGTDYTVELNNIGTTFKKK